MWYRSNSQASPFHSPAFLRRLQKMIETPRGRPTEAELAIEEAVRKLRRGSEPRRNATRSGA